MNIRVLSTESIPVTKLPPECPRVVENVWWAVDEWGQQERREYQSWSLIGWIYKWKRHIPVVRNRRPLLPITVHSQSVERGVWEGVGEGMLSERGWVISWLGRLINGRVRRCRKGVRAGWGEGNWMEEAIEWRAVSSYYVGWREQTMYYNIAKCTSYKQSFTVTYILYIE